MRTEVQESLQTQFQRALRLAARVLIAALLTALVGAAENWFYERFFAPELYVTGDPVVRAAFAATLTFPFILAGLVIVGLPVAYLLRRIRAESGVVYAAAGAVSGLLVGAAIGFQTTYGFLVSAFYGCSCALFWWWARPKS
jgi:hypothetical protein